MSTSSKPSSPDPAVTNIPGILCLVDGVQGFPGPGPCTGLPKTPGPLTPVPEVPGCTNKMRFSNLDQYYLTDKKSVDNFLKTQSTSNLARALSIPDLSLDCHAIIFRALSSRWRTFTDTDVHSMGPGTLRELLSHQAYDNSPEQGTAGDRYQQEMLENVLCSVTCWWFGLHHDATPEMFQDMVRLLKCELLTPNSLIDLIKLPQYSQANELDPTLDSMFISVLSGRYLVVSHDNRFSVPENGPVIEFSMDRVSVGDKVDAMDSQKIWFVGTVLEKNGPMLYIAFDGWSAKYNEWLDSDKIRTVGSKTNGISHHNPNTCEKRVCDCGACRCTYCAGRLPIRWHGTDSDTNGSTDPMKCEGPGQKDELARIPVTMDQLSVGDRVDARDLEGNWFVGKILEKNDHAVHIAFDGWKPAYNEWLSCSRLAKFGSMTRGISHQSKEYSKVAGPCKCLYCEKKQQQQQQEVSGVLQKLSKQEERELNGWLAALNRYWL
jgi:hypothetical protein